MNKFVLKNSKGKFFTLSGVYNATDNLRNAKAYTEADADLVAKSINKSYGTDFQAVPLEKELMRYFPYCVMHTDNAPEAQARVARIRAGKVRGYTDACVINMQGAFMVYARKEYEPA